MRQYKIAAVFLSALFLFASCSSTESFNISNGFRIDYYSGRGFTGFENGITVYSNGVLKFWESKSNSIRIEKDSLQLSNVQIKILSDMIKNPELFSYSPKYSGNYTTYLVLMSGIQFNKISFNASDLPKDMPSSVKNIIAEIQKIYNK